MSTSQPSYEQGSNGNSLNNSEYTRSSVLPDGKRVFLNASNNNKENVFRINGKSNLMHTNSENPGCVIPPLKTSNSTLTYPSSASTSIKTNNKAKKVTSRSFLNAERDVASIRARMNRDNSSSSSSETKDNIHKIALTGSSRLNHPTYLRRNTSTNSNSDTKTSRILRYGETLDSLFGLTHTDCPKEHRLLCDNIVNGFKIDDAEAWKIALEYASNHLPEGDDGQNLIRLHRRATSRLMNNSHAITEVTSNHLLSIYLSYAQAQAQYSSSNNARQTYNFILNKRIGEYNAMLYLAIAEFERKEGNFDFAIKSLKRGLNKGAKPDDVLKIKIKEYEQNMLKQETVMGDGKIVKEEESKITGDRTAGGKMYVPPLPSTKENTITGKKNDSAPISRENTKDLPDHDETSSSHKSKRNNYSSNQNLHKIEVNKPSTDEYASILSSHIDDVSTIKDELNSSPMSESLEFDIQPKTTRLIDPPDKPLQLTDAESKSIDTNSQNNSGDVFEHYTGSSKNTRNGGALADTDINNTTNAALKTSKAKSPKVLFSQSTFSSTTNPQQPLAKTRIHGFLSKNKQSLLSRNKRSGMLGGAQRLAPHDAVADSDDSESDGTSTAANNKKTNKRSNTFTKPAPKLTRIDLGYMLNWDPERSRKPALSSSPSNPSQSERKHGEIGLAMEKIEEESPTDGFTGNSVRTQTDSSHDSRPSAERTLEKNQGRENSHDLRGTKEAQSNQCTHSPTEARIQEEGTNSSHSPQETTIMSKANVEFLPLVSEANILRVNSTPYVKLGVIGKGGSCKVYRALSKDCAVLAIKKVKLDGMDQKAISGYANEIALLKKLRGNPSIIQMYDSEVDLERKSIFLVMELGEVDLNHVLQQQGKIQQKYKTTSGRFEPTLNMNFIRLTWQQMLNAVHSIHEERIIHSDLKPANFLFVRGALKLIDFGIAKAIQSEDTTNIYRDSQIGTLNYMSPEAILDTGSGGNKARMKLGRASDIWSLGCILYQMVYGRTPFADLHMIQKLQAIINPEHEIKYPMISEEAAIDAIKLCLQRDPSQRPPIVGKMGLLNEHWFLHSSSRLFT